MIFKLPLTIYDGLRDAPIQWPKTPLAYVEWYSKVPASPDAVHGMYAIKKVKPRTDGTISGSIIPLSQIRQTCQLQPYWTGPHVDSSTYTTDNVLDVSDNFVLNNWTSMHAYQTIW